MTLNEYQGRAKSTAIYPKPHVLPIYPALGLCDEAGEVAGKIKKALRDGVGETFMQDVKAELGDVLWYLAAMAGDLGINLDEIAQANLDKLESRRQRGTLQGSGDNR